jgi:uncharacterized membrane protein
MEASMMRTALRALTLAALLCVSSALRAQPADAPKQAEKRPGYGVVESVVAIRRPAQQDSASTGASAPSRTRYTYRLRVRLDDGTIQYRDIKADEFAVGDRVLLTNAGDVLPD